ncbi:MAG: phosphotransferase [Caldilineaceae bacterium]|nr:phosphotransferase [Caldilineaceae bacterium]
MTNHCADMDPTAVRPSDDAELADVMAALGVGPDALLGRGGEAWVLALDEERVARVSRGGLENAVWISARTALLAEMARHAQTVTFAIPAVVDTRIVAGHIVTVEPRLPGRPLIELLCEAVGAVRVALIRAYLDAAALIGDLQIDRPWFGDLCTPTAIQTGNFRSYLAQRAARSLRMAGQDFDGIDPVSLAAALPEPARARLVHLDAWPGNMLAQGQSITAVIDFGAATIMGDRRLDPLTAAIYLEQPITPSANDGDLAVAMRWLRDQDLAQHHTAARRWIAAYWSFATDDVALHHWCRSVLLD